MLGPSGSGKTTCLRLIAGFEQPTAGHIAIFGERAEGVPPYRRNVNTVFQDYALFPHLNVLRQRRLRADGARASPRPSATRRPRRCWRSSARRASATASRRSSPAASASAWRSPARWSTARACCCSTSRSARSTSSCARTMQDELKALQKRLGITFVFVTHDQGEALSMADRVAVFNDGRIAQVGTPQEIYERPRTRFVADFVGSSNVLPPESSARFGAPAGRACGRRRCGSTAPDGAASPAPSRPRATSAPAPGSPSTSAARELTRRRRRPATPVPRAGARVGLAWAPERCT